MRSIPCAILMAALAGCGEEARVAPVAPAAELAASLETSESQNAVLFPKTAHPYGASLSTCAHGAGNRHRSPSAAAEAAPSRAAKPYSWKSAPT